MKNLIKKTLIGTTIAGSILLCQTGICSKKLNIGGYWENWCSAINEGATSDKSPDYYSIDTQNFNHVYYSFLTLDKNPNPDSPANKQWDGKGIYESMTHQDVSIVMDEKDYNYKWQGDRIRALMAQCQKNNKQFIWAIGGWSDLKMTISDEQIPVFVEKCVELLKLGGDGIDFDWEHLSTNSDIKSQQRKVIGKILVELRKALDENNMNDKKLGYTTRFNAFWDENTKPVNVSSFPSDGEGIDVANAAKEAGSSLDKCVDWINIMMYDVNPKEVGATGETFTLENYKQVLSFFEKYVSKEKIVMGFEPGGQAAGGIWEGMDIDKQVIDYVKTNNYGGVMFWAINQPKYKTSQEITGLNAQELAGHANNYKNAEFRQI